MYRALINGCYYRQRLGTETLYTIFKIFQKPHLVDVITCFQFRNWETKYYNVKWLEFELWHHGGNLYLPGTSSEPPAVSVAFFPPASAIYYYEGSYAE